MFDKCKIKISKIKAWSKQPYTTNNGSVLANELIQFLALLNFAYVICMK